MTTCTCRLRTCKTRCPRTPSSQSPLARSSRSSEYTLDSHLFYTARTRACVCVCLYVCVCVLGATACSKLPHQLQQHALDTIDAIDMGQINNTAHMHAYQYAPLQKYGAEDLRLSCVQLLPLYPATHLQSPHFGSEPGHFGVGTVPVIKPAPVLSVVALAVLVAGLTM